MIYSWWHLVEMQWKRDCGSSRYKGVQQIYYRPFIHQTDCCVKCQSTEKVQCFPKTFRFFGDITLKRNRLWGGTTSADWNWVYSSSADGRAISEGEFWADDGRCKAVHFLDSQLQTTVRNRGCLHIYNCNVFLSEIEFSFFLGRSFIINRVIFSGYVPFWVEMFTNAPKLNTLSSNSDFPRQCKEHFLILLTGKRSHLK